MTPSSVVIVGAGHSGFQLAHSLRDEAFTGSITLIDAQPSLPYQRPPLSKSYLSAPGIPPEALFRPSEFFRAHDIDIVVSRVNSIDRDNRQVVLASGKLVRYDHLVIATGAANRTPPIAGLDAEGVTPLRILADADFLRGRLRWSHDVIVIGGGFIGLEVAAAATKRGSRVTVIEASQRVMGRAVSPRISTYFTELHTKHQVDIRLGMGVAAVQSDVSGVVAAELNDGTIIPADLVVYGVGVLPVTKLAEEAGLEVDNGVLVDEFLRTGDPLISAIGDAAAFPLDGSRRRVESVQNAADQARLVARRLVGRPIKPYLPTPWFWSEQFDTKLQIAGLLSGDEEVVEIGDARGFSLLHFRGQRLAAAESINRPSDHVAARKLIASGKMLDPDAAREPDFRLVDYTNSRLTV